MVYRARCTILSLVPLLTLAVGCADSSATTPQSAEEAEMGPADFATQTASDATGEASVAAVDTPDAAGPPRDSAEALAELTEAVYDAFDGSTVVESLIYPKGWVKRRLDPLGIEYDVAEGDGGEAPSTATIRLTFQRLNSMIHPSEEAARADDQLLPYPPGPSREDMTNDQFVEPYPEVELAIEYQWQEDRWVRQAWTTTPKVTVGSDWLDRLGVP